VVRTPLPLVHRIPRHHHHRRRYRYRYLGSTCGGWGRRWFLRVLQQAFVGRSWSLVCVHIYIHRIYDENCRWRVRECASVFALTIRRGAHARTTVQFDLDPPQPTTRRPSPIGPPSRARRSFYRVRVNYCTQLKK